MQLFKRIHESLANVFNGAHSAAQTAPEQHPARQNTGMMAEQLAGTYLSRAGLKIVARNVRSRWGEIDLIGTDGETLVFVEVRLRTDPRFGGAAESISPAKRRRLVRTANHFLAHGGRLWQGRPCRFDVVLLDRLHLAHIEWIRNAFDAA
jgi:putative endonuclease